MRLEVRDLAWGPATRPIFSGICLDVAPGRVVGILGPNGSGKSSLLRCVYRYNRPSAGQVLVDGRDVWSMTARESARLIAVVLQEPPGEFGLTVRELVALGRAPHLGALAAETKQDRAIITDALARVDLAGFGDRRFATLSGGEKQRALVARALAQQPRLIILDEPTNHLDIRHQIDLLRLVRGLGIGVLASLHDLNLASAFCDHLHVLHDGRIVASGGPGDVLTEAVVRTVYGVDTAVDTHPASSRPRVTYLH